MREQRQKQQEANGKEKTRGSASSAEITAAAVGAALNEHALTEGDLRVLRKRAQEEGTTTDKRQHDYLDRMRASYEQQVQRTRSADSRRARAQDRPPSTNTLTIEAAGLPGAQKIKLGKKDTEGGLNVRRMKMDELKQKASDVTGDDSGSKVELIARITGTLLANAAT